MSTTDPAAAANLARLAETLIARHLRISIPDGQVRDQLALAHKDSAYPATDIERERRCVAVIGAGASAPLLKRADDLATHLEATFQRDEIELERLTLVSGLRADAFETRLIALSRTPEAARQVRETISAEYDIRHPPLLVYELLAHLLKHRFLDAIISFNFDELLDQSLDDELDTNEYAQVVFERDCAGVESNADAPGYVPLYIKLHGTASEPESLRFTLDSYYALPPRVVALVRDLLRAGECDILAVGSGLSSFDFQRLLSIPQDLKIYNLSRDPLPDAVVKQIDAERSGQTSGSWRFECNDDQEESGTLLQRLVQQIEERSGGDEPEDLLRFRSVRRHETSAALLGSDTLSRALATAPECRHAAQIAHVKRRTILELAFAGAKARGLLSLAPLALDRPSRYFDLYRRLTNGQGDSWRTFCSAAGLMESAEVPDILVSEPRLRKPASPGSALERRELHEFDSRMLAERVLSRVKNPCSDEELQLLCATIDQLQVDSDIEIQSYDDRVCSKAFERPVILATASALQAYTWLMLQNLDVEDEIHIASETGGWLLTDQMRALLVPQRRVRVLLAFGIDRAELHSKYPDGNLESQVTDPWRHNRHMTIVCRGSQPRHAIYFARRLRTPVVTPVYLEHPGDIDRLMELYEARWKEVPTVMSDEPEEGSPAEG